MSTYYSFYPAVMRDGKLELIGQYINVNGEMKLEPVLCRSRSFIHIDEFEASLFPLSMMTEEQMPMLTYDMGGGERQPTAMYLSVSEVSNKAGDGMIRGYAELDAIDAAAWSGYDSVLLSNIDVRSPEYASELPEEERRKYGQIAFVDGNSTDYLCGLLMEAVESYDFVIKEPLYFVINIT